ncbi:hypothetical protein Vafri_12114 [Volvox africanus]|uniref:Uncharacterized protein n=1 Tax=Volvox africanus TaxID=51714 RepID=A0A8J4F250_9CHLO|nr:hypothetical protein Vafri_12114 [Volvox africanus]
MRECQLREVWWPAGQPSRMALRQLFLNRATLSGQAAVPDPESPMGLASVLRHSAATLEHLDLSGLGSPRSGSGSWITPLAALAAAADGIAPRLTHLDLSCTAVQPEDLACLQCAPALKILSLSGTNAGSPQGAAALVAGGLSGLQDLDLSFCSVTDNMVSWLKQLTGLTALNLSDNPDLSLAPTASPRPGQPPDPHQRWHLGIRDMMLSDTWAASYAPDMLATAAPPPLDPDDGARLAPVAAAAATSTSGMGAVAEGGGNSVGSNSSLTDPGSCANCGCIWPYLRRLNLIWTRVGEAGFRSLFSTDGCRGRGGGLEVSEATRAMACKGPLRRLEELKAGSPAITNGVVEILAAARLPNLRSLLLRDALLTGQGARLLPSSLPLLQRLELQACRFVSVKDGRKVAATCKAGALVLINAKAFAAAGTSAGVPSGNRAVATPPGSLIPIMVGTSTCEREQSVASSGLTSASAPRAQQNRGAASVWTIAAGNTNNQGNTVSGQDDLSHFDQRLRYDKETLLRLAASPLAEGAGIGGRNCHEIMAGRPNDGSEPLYVAFANLPEAIRR